MATVYLADDIKHERKVALEVLKPELVAVVGAAPIDKGLQPRAEPAASRRWDQPSILARQRGPVDPLVRRGRLPVSTHERGGPLYRLDDLTRLSVASAVHRIVT